jgi:glycosyltransferase involved in cell wall biosynthesis
MGRHLKVVVIFPGTVTAAWSVSDGIGNTLRKMGHEVRDFPRGRPYCPTLTPDDLKDADLIIASGFEHLSRDQRLSPFDDRYVSIALWKKLQIPKVAWYHESARRPLDAPIASVWKGIEPLIDQHFFPAIQDAEMYDQPHFANGRSHWLPFGVDTDVFKPAGCPKCKGYPEYLIKAKGLVTDLDLVMHPGSIIPVKNTDIVRTICEVCAGVGHVPTKKTVNIGFIGLMYGPRADYAAKLAQHLHEVQIVTGSVQVVDLDGIPFEENAHRLAANYRRIKIFFNFPAMSQLLVTKVYEIMACGTMLVTPYVTGAGEHNLDVFEHTKHLVYYDPNNLAFINQVLREFQERDTDREFMALRGMREVHEKHSLRLRLEQMLQVCKLTGEDDGRPAHADSGGAAEGTGNQNHADLQAPHPRTGDSPHDAG